jgi:hypothetical protein
MIRHHDSSYGETALVMRADLGRCLTGWSEMLFEPARGRKNLHQSKTPA